MFPIHHIFRLKECSDGSGTNQSDEEKERQARSVEAQRSELDKLQADVGKEHCRLASVPCLSNVTSAGGAEGPSWAIGRVYFWTHFGGFLAIPPQVDHVTDDHRFSRLLKDLPSVGDRSWYHFKGSFS